MFCLGKWDSGGGGSKIKSSRYLKAAERCVRVRRSRIKPKFYRSFSELCPCPKGHSSLSTLVSRERLEGREKPLSRFLIPRAAFPLGVLCTILCPTCRSCLTIPGKIAGCQPVAFQSPQVRLHEQYTRYSKHGTPRWAGRGIIMPWGLAERVSSFKARTVSGFRWDWGLP